MTTLATALEIALEHWGGRPGAGTLGAAAGRCVVILGPARTLSDLKPSDGVTLLATLRATLKPKSVQVYYGAFRRMAALNGRKLEDWPCAPTPPRRTRDPLKASDLERLLSWLRAAGWGDTADLAVLMRGTGIRVAREGLHQTALTYTGPVEGQSFGVLHVAGKGGHERLIPVVRQDTMDLLDSPSRLAIMRICAYRTHLERWTKGVRALGIKSRLATPHAVRHGYATEALRKSGGNLAMVQELLGHADIATTSRYVAVDLADKAEALSKGA